MINRLIIALILLILIVICVLLVVNNNRGKSIMEEIKNKVTNTNTTFDFDNRYVILNNGVKIPIIGLGTWSFTNEEAEEAVYVAIKNGYRLIDTAQYYGDEVGVGNGVRKAIDEGIIKREDVFVTSKIYASTDHSRAIEKTLHNLDIEC